MLNASRYVGAGKGAGREARFGLTEKAALVADLRALATAIEHGAVVVTQVDTSESAHRNEFQTTSACIVYQTIRDVRRPSGPGDVGVTIKIDASEVREVLDKYSADLAKATADAARLFAGSDAINRFKY
jgi:hypothetical protein